MPEAVLGLGGNLGARRAIFDAALTLLAAAPGCTLLARSLLYETPPLGPPQPDFLNAAVRVSWEGTAEQLLAQAQRIEALLGRERRVRWGARTIDLDVLHWSAGSVRSAGLEVPHRELHTRTFALAPLLDVAPELATAWRDTLLGLGGAPALARPGWPALVREDAYLCGDWQHDPAELGSQLAALAGQALSARLHGDAAELAPSNVGWGVEAFTGPAELLDGDGRSWLEAVVVAATARGFTVRTAAVVERDEARTKGVLVGFGDARAEAPSGLPEALASALSVRVEQRDDGQRRVKVRVDTSERGFDFNGSGTM
jgi:2-amino-4-hydroxy-6-hydroxymethyldihydropteridine diphosphokinase